MSRTKLSSGLSHAAIALLIVPLIIGGMAYVAVNPLAMGNPAVGAVHSVTPQAPPTSYGIQDRQMLREHCENVTTVTIEGMVVNVSVGTGEKATMTVEESTGEVRTVLIGGMWLGPNKTLLTPQELASKVDAGDHVVITAFIACDGDVRATKIDVGGTTYVLLHGPQIHGFHGHYGGEPHAQGHHGPCNCCGCHNG